MKIRKKQAFLLIFVLLIIILLENIFKKSMVLIYISNFYIPAKQLPDKWVIPALEYVTEIEFPKNLSNIHGIFQGGRDHSIFAAFNADPNQLEQIIIQNSLNTDIKNVDAEYLINLKSYDANLFPIANLWQEELNLKLFDPNSIKNGRLIENNDNRGFTVLIDTDAHKAYIFAWH